MSDKEHGITRDPQTGRIIKKVLTPEQAREMGKRKHMKPIEEGVNELLEFMELEGPLASNLAEILVKGGSPGVAAAKELLRMRDRKYQPDAKQIEVLPGRYYLCSMDGTLHEVGIADKLAHLFSKVLDGREQRPSRFKGLPSGN